MYRMAYHNIAKLFPVTERIFIPTWAIIEQSAFRSDIGYIVHPPYVLLKFVKRLDHQPEP